MYIKLGFINENREDVRYLLYNINGFPQKIVSNIGQIVTVFIPKEKKLHDFLPITLNNSENKKEINENIKEILIQKGFKEINPNDLNFFEDKIDNILESIEIDSSSNDSTSETDFILIEED